jgi:hypothetical protein
MVVDRISNLLPVLVGLSLLSSVAGVLSAQIYPGQACFQQPPGSPNRMPPCIKWERCYWGPEITGTCPVNGRDLPILSGNNFVEHQYGYCKLFPDTECELTAPVVCQTYTAYIDALCQDRPPDCFGKITVPGCKTRF